MAFAARVRAGIRTALVMAFAAAWVGAAGPASAACNLVGIAQLPVTMEGLWPLVPAKIDGAQTRLILDTGAFYSMLTFDSAKKFGLRAGGTRQSARLLGVNGSFGVGITNVTDLNVLGRNFQDVSFLVGGSELGTDISGLLGQNFLNVDDGEYDLANGIMRIFRPQGCDGANLAYWASGRPFSVIPILRTEVGERRIRGEVVINGVKFRAQFDTGSPESYLTLRAAARAGLHPKDPGAKAGGSTGGLGRREIESWIVPVKSFKIGDEEILNTQLRIGDIDLEDDDMLIGADFFLSHRVFVANSQHRMFFTYNGGPVFNLESSAKAPPAAVGNQAPGSSGEKPPEDAGGFARRGEAYAARKEYALALADLTRAIALEPNDAQHRFDRGQIYVEQKDLKSATADYDEAVKLSPKNVQMRMARADLELRSHDLAAAKTDFDAALAQDDTQRLAVASTYEYEGEFEVAVAVYGQVLAAKPKEVDKLQALNGRCWSRALWNHDLDKALADCDQALSLSPRWDAPIDSRAMVRLRMRQYDRALGDYDRVVKDGHKSAWTLLGRGLALLALGRKAEGDADLKHSAEIDPDLAEKAKGYGLAP